MSALTVSGLKTSYRVGWGPWARDVPVLHGVDLRVDHGEVVGLIGESGCGKTTLVRTALGLLPPTAGSVHVLGQDLAGLSARQRRDLRSRAQLLFQDPAAMLNPGLTVDQHLMESAQLHRPDQVPEHVVAKVVRQVGLEHRQGALPRQLSGGERRRVGLARVLVADPVLLVADEPTAGLDAALKADLVELLLSGRGPERAFLLVSHDLPLMAYFCDRLVVMQGGHVVDRIAVPELGRRPHHPYTTLLLQNAGMLQVSA